MLGERPLVPLLGFSVAAVLLASTACRHAPSASLSDGEIRYWTEAGLEFGHDELARACADIATLRALQTSATTAFVSFPGRETPIREMYGHDLPSRISVTISVRMSKEDPEAFIIRSVAHHDGGKDIAAEATTTCVRVATRKRPREGG